MMNVHTLDRLASRFQSAVLRVVGIYELTCGLDGAI